MLHNFYSGTSSHLQKTQKTQRELTWTVKHMLLQRGKKQWSMKKLIWAHAPTTKQADKLRKE